ncbi:unnamed protein product [Parascedosporium putredinis]|uniref:Cytochrome b-c1 complex subunit 7 n=1 Tax=Parascedosporium putredinis TaxID=1442378 RepID=A0A9P1H4B1_9PEZI|nr:unnamed protein product [Parascedosporium putredinis]CAI7995859.1 unnamed protein product [Parascedosporium putredinis]
MSSVTKLTGAVKYDDCLDMEESPIGQLALKRLSPKESYDRVYRIRRAFQLSISHKILPKEQWTKVEEDKPYLQPIIDQIKAEINEKEALDSMEVVKTH